MSESTISPRTCGVADHVRVAAAEQAQLMSAVVEAAAQVHAAEAKLIEALSALVGPDGPGVGGYRSAAQFLSARAGFTAADARRRVAVARRAGDMPAVVNAAGEGRLSVGVAAMAARVVTGRNQAEVADVCLTMSPTQAERVLRAYQGVGEALAADAQDPAPPQPFLRSRWDEHHMLRLSARLATEDGKLLESALAAMKAAAQRAEAEPAPFPAPPTVSDLDALHLLASAGLVSSSADGLTDRWGERFGVTVTVDLATLLDGDVVAGTCCVDGEAVSAQRARLLSCDARVQTLLHQAHRAIALGRERRTPNRAMRRALRWRDGGCRFPGCTQRRWLDAHHIVHWADGGHTSLENLVLLCRRHHRAVHEEGWRIVGDPNRLLDWIDPQGRLVGPRGAGVAAPPRRRLAPQAATSVTAGEPLTSYALDVFLERLLTAGPPLAVAELANGPPLS